MPDPFTVYGCPSTDEYLQAKEQSSSFAPLVEVGLAKLVFNVDDRRLEVFWGDGSQSSFNPITDFLSLPDTPSSYAGAGGYFLKVKATEDGIEFASGGGAGTDELVKVSSSDTSAGYLNSKLVAGSNITLTVLNAGGNEQLEISASGGGGGASTFLDLSDTPTSYTGSGGLTVKVKATEDGLEFLPDEDELVKVSSTDTTSGYLGAKLQAGAKISITTQNAGANESLLIETSAAEINDATTSASETWSSSKISSELGAKADKVSGATAGNFASLDAGGNLQDSGYSSSSFASATHTHSLPDLSDTSISSPQADQQLLYNGTAWINGSIIDDASTGTNRTWSASKIGSELGSKIPLVAPATTGNFVRLLSDGSLEDAGVSQSSFASATHTHTLGDLSDVDTSGAASGQVLQFNGSLWVPASAGGSDTFKAKVSGTDTTEDFLQAKIVAGSGITISVLNSGANEQLEVAHDGSHKIIFDQTLSANASSVLFSGLNIGAGELIGFRLEGQLDDGQGGSSGFTYGDIGVKVNGISSGWLAERLYYIGGSVGADQYAKSLVGMARVLGSNSIVVGKFASVQGYPSFRSYCEPFLDQFEFRYIYSTYLSSGGQSTITSIEFYNDNASLEFKSGFKFTAWKIL